MTNPDNEPQNSNERKEEESLPKPIPSSNNSGKEPGKEQGDGGRIVPNSVAFGWGRTNFCITSIYQHLLKLGGRHRFI